MSIPKLTTDLAVIQKLSDLPNSTEGLTAQALKARFDESGLAIQKWINESLLPNLVAKNLPFAGTSELNAADVQAAIELVHSQIRGAASGAIVNGSVTREKLAAELLERVFGGRPWISLDTPSAEDTPEKDFPVGQIWLRPGFTVSNMAGSSWTTSGCTVSANDDGIIVSGSQTVSAVSVSQNLVNIGQEGDRVYVLFDIRNRDSEITALTVSINAGAEQDASGGVFTGALMANGSLTVKLSAVWPSTSLAGGSFDLVNYAVVNIDQIMRQNSAAAEIVDWVGYLTGLLPLTAYVSPAEVFIQTGSGIWWPMSYAVQPVSRGGTGNGTVAYGEILYGGNENAMERLEKPAENNSFLQFVDGRPVWKDPVEAAGNTGIARIVTGTYTGNGASRTVTLPVTPKLLHISSPSGAETQKGFSWSGDPFVDRPVTLTQGGQDNEWYTEKVDSSSYSNSLASIRLNGNGITLSGPYLCNRSGITYNWVAIY